MEILLLDEQVDLPEHLADVRRKGYGALAEHQQDVSDGRVQAWSWQQAVVKGVTSGRPCRTVTHRTNLRGCGILLNDTVHGHVVPGFVQVRLRDDLCMFEFQILQDLRLETVELAHALHLPLIG